MRDRSSSGRRLRQSHAAHMSPGAQICASRVTTSARWFGLRVEQAAKPCASTPRRLRGGMLFSLLRRERPQLGDDGRRQITEERSPDHARDGYHSSCSYLPVGFGVPGSVGSLG